MEITKPATKPVTKGIMPTPEPPPTEGLIPVSGPSLKLHNAGSYSNLPESSLVDFDIGDSVGNQKSLSGTTNDISQVTASAQPLYVRDELNGNNILRYASFDSLFIDTDFTNIVSSDQATYFAVLKLSSIPSGERNIFGVVFTGSSDRFTVGGFGVGGFGSAQFIHTSQQSGQINIGGFSTNQWLLMTLVRKTNGSGEVFINGVSTSSGAMGNPIATGNRFIVNGKGGLDIAEIAIYNEELTAQEITDNNDYFLTKYAL